MKAFTFSFLLLIVSSCSTKKATSQKKALNLSFSTPLSTTNPTIASDIPSYFVVRLLFEGLTRLDEQGNTALAVAEKYTVSEDFKTYTFTLRETFWSDGKPVTAHDFEYAWKKCIDPKTGSIKAKTLYVIKNAKLAAQKKVPMSEVGIKALDPCTLQFELEYPIPYLLDLLRLPCFYPIPEHLDETDSSWIHRTDQTFVSNGPFRLKKWKQQEGITLEKSSSYWDQQHISLPEVTISFITDQVTQVYLYEKDQLDWIGDPINRIPQDALAILKQQVGYSCLDSPVINGFLVNSQAFPFHNKKMRQAFSYALDRTAIVDHILGGNKALAYGVISPFFGLGNSPCFEDGKFDAAKRLFNEALEEEGLTLETFPEVTLKYFTGYETFSQISHILQEVWTQTFGIKVILSSSDWSTHIAGVRKEDYQIAAIAFSYNIDPIQILEVFKYENGTNNSINWRSSQEYNDLLKASNYETDLEKRKRILIAAEKLLMDEMPIIPIYYGTTEFSKKPCLTGVVVSKGDVDFRFARFSP